MHLDKIIKREVTGIIVTTLILLTLFIGVSFAVFFSIDEGEENVIEVGDINVTFCKDVNCGEEYANYGQVIGMETVDGVSTPSAIYPYETTALALETTPYIFNIKNTGDLKVFFSAYLNEDKDFVPSGNYANYTSITELYSNYVKIGVSECTDGNIDTSAVEEYNFGELVNGKIISDIEVNVGDEKTYCLWTWLDESTPNEVQETYFVANLSFTAEYVPTNSNLVDVMIRDNEVQSDESINFGAISSDTNGKGLYRTSDLTKTEDINGDGTGEEVLYFRGAVENNYVVFADFCWRIVRTNEDGSIKLRYGGTPTSGSCPQTGTAVQISNTSFNTIATAAKYVQYVYDTNTSSTAKSTIDTWYANNIATKGTSITSQVVDTPYCNDISGSTSAYGAYTRLSATTPTPQYKCPQASDKYTVSSDNGNGKLTYPVALLTADEVAYAGGKYGTNNTTYYLYRGGDYWTMSPYYFNGSNAYEFRVNSTGNLALGSVNGTVGLLPAVSLSADAEVIQGTGLYNDPYIIG